MFIVFVYWFFTSDRFLPTEDGFGCGRVRLSGICEISPPTWDP